MPIKFRCQYCQQLLGISRSRAGAVVDCPGCGRSLRVPQQDGTAEAVPRRALPRDEAGRLLAELQTLSALSAEAAQQPAATEIPADDAAEPLRIVPLSAVHPAPPETPVAPPTAATPSARRPRSATGPAAARPPAEPLTPAAAAPPTANPETAVSPQRPEDHSAARPAELAQALAELTTLHKDRPASENAADQAVPSGAAPAAARFAGTRPLTKPPMRIRLSAVSFLCLVAFGLGMLGMRLWTTTAPAAEDAAAEDTTVEAPGDASGAAAEAAMSGPVATQVAPAGDVPGRVTWTATGGAPQPDAGALVLLLPATHPGRLRLDGASLRELSPDTDQQAVRAALQVLGGSFVRADADGRFRLPRWSPAAMQLFVVSRHQARAAGTPLPAAVTTAWSAYFEAPELLAGRLSVSMQTLAPLTSATGQLAAPDAAPATASSPDSIRGQPLDEELHIHFP